MEKQYSGTPQIMDILAMFKSKPIRGVVYAVEFEDGLVKIGSCLNPAQRFYSLQGSYMGKPLRIVKTYVSAIHDDIREAEREAQKDLTPAVKGKKEIYRMSFADAVIRVSNATGGYNHESITLDRLETIRKYHRLARAYEGKIIVEEAFTEAFLKFSSISTELGERLRTQTE